MLLRKRAFFSLILLIAYSEFKFLPNEPHGNVSRVWIIELTHHNRTALGATCGPSGPVWWSEAWLPISAHTQPKERYISAEAKRVVPDWSAFVIAGPAAGYSRCR